MESRTSFEGLSCQEIFAKLSEYLDGELSPELFLQMTGHIEGCGPCVEFVQSLRESIALCHEFTNTDTPAPLAHRMRDELRAAYEKAARTGG